MLDFMNGRKKIGRFKHSALEWWNSLTQEQQQDYEYRTFGNGEIWEDNTLTYIDIETMYMNINK